MFKKYLYYDTLDFSSKENFREQYCHTISGELDFSKEMIEQIKTFSYRMYSAMTESNYM